MIILLLKYHTLSYNYEKNWINMNKVILSVDDENLETVLMILSNLKNGLIREITTDAQVIKVKSTQYKPKVKTIIREEDSGTNDKNGKYINPSAYKKRLQAKR
ncbi:MAG: hypothetical protein ACJAWW_002539 [Sulfurimonas sp.]|jgi:hypothetical protein